MTESATPTLTPAQRPWMRDGHTARVVIDQDCLRVHLACPEDGRDFDGVDFDVLPQCRRGYSESGEFDPAESPLGYCNFIEWVTADDPMECIARDLTTGVEWTVVGEFPIGIRWTGDYYEWAPSALIDAANRRLDG